MKAHRILLVRMSAMGDIIHTLPAAASLRHAFPDAEIDWIVEEVWAPLLADNPHITTVRTIRSRDPRDVLAVIRALRSRAYDVALDFQGLVKSGFLAAMSGSKQVLGFRTEALREKVAAAFYHRQVTPAGTHVVEMNISLARAAGAREACLEFPLPHPAHVDLPDRFVAISPSAGWAAKCWPAASYAELIRRLHQERAIPVVINCGPDDDELAGQVARLAAPARPQIFHGGIPELVALAQRAAAFVAGDTGPLHIAAAAGTPVIALFGPTSPERNGPYGPRVRVLRADDAVTTYSRSQDASAIARLSVDTVFQAVAEVL